MEQTDRAVPEARASGSVASSGELREARPARRFRTRSDDGRIVFDHEWRNEPEERERAIGEHVVPICIARGLQRRGETREQRCRWRGPVVSVGASERTHVSRQLGGKLAFEQVERHLRLQGVTGSHRRKYVGLQLQCEL
jgi:hypothetical protein